MLKQIEVTSSSITTPITFKIAGANSGESFILADAIGLGPVKADINTIRYANQDGEYFNSASVGGRNIVLTVELNPNYSLWEDPSSLRDLLYRMFYPKQEVSLKVETTHIGEDVTISGYVESVEPTLFASETKVQISIICPDPYFQGSLKVSTGNAVGLSMTINNPGHVDSPLDVWFGLASGTSPGLGIRRLGTTEYMGYQSYRTISFEEVYQASTNPGDKFLWQHWPSSGADFHAISNSNTWLVIRPGSNTFILSKGNLTPTSVPGYMEFHYRSRYLGV